VRCAGLLLRSLEPEPSYETLEATRSEDRHFELAPHPRLRRVGAARITLANAMNDGAGGGKRAVCVYCCRCSR